MSCPKCAPQNPGDDGGHKPHHLHVPGLSRGSETAQATHRTSVIEDTPTTEPTVVLVGNPNVGKSTLFNTVTGARQDVVNAPGTTVEVMQGHWGAVGARVLDLPGTYSLIANSPDEQVVVDTLAGVPGSFTDPVRGRSVDLVVVLLEATALTRSLY